MRSTTAVAVVRDAGRDRLLCLLQRMGHGRLQHRGHKRKAGLVVVFILKRSLHFFPERSARVTARPNASSLSCALKLPFVC